MKRNIRNEIRALREPIANALEQVHKVERSNREQRDDDSLEAVRRSLNMSARQRGWTNGWLNGWTKA